MEEAWGGRGREISVIFSIIKILKKRLVRENNVILSFEFSEGRNLVVHKNIV